MEMTALENGRPNSTAGKTTESGKKTSSADRVVLNPVFFQLCYLIRHLPVLYFPLNIHINH